MCLCHWTTVTTGRYEFATFITLLLHFILDNERYVEANAGCKHFDAHGGPEDIPVSRLSFNAKVISLCIYIYIYIYICIG